MRVLTKSRFKLGLECPNKLFYTSKREYTNKKSGDPFMKALSKGGFQVEELAKMHYPDGVFINTEHHEYEKAAKLTYQTLQLENVVVFEAAFLVDGYFIRTDILVKTGNKVRLIEVKAKSFDPNDEHTFLGKGGGLTAKWKSYLFDLAFQKWVIQKAYPSFQVEAFLMLADKSKKATVNGLNQFFRIPANGNPRTDVIKKITTLAEAGEPILSEVNVDTIVNEILANNREYSEGLNFTTAVSTFKEAYTNDKFMNSEINYSKCKKCEFKANKEDEAKGELSGFKNCFTHLQKWEAEDFDRPNVFEIWRCRGKKLIENNHLFLDQVTDGDIEVILEPNKYSTSERQWIQIATSIGKLKGFQVRKEDLKVEMSKWKFPLHFIDFETSTVALPFTIGRIPYEQVAFQFSHHIYHENGNIEHHSEFINNTPGEFPNFFFARTLRNVLKEDLGTIFRFAAHENSIINAIINQLNESEEADRDELIVFLKSITKSTEKNVEKWHGERCMVDLNEVVKFYYYNPITKGSNSIKAVLPATLNSSKFLQTKYCKPIGSILVTSKNFDTNHIWLKVESGEVINPYELLPPVFEGWEDKDLKYNISEITEIADGGAALTAYSKLQYQDMTEKERNDITKALLKYCELDTLAMVMIYEHFKEITA